MNAGWPMRKLSDIAEIRISNVDKKIHAGEKPVKLCNYMNVYSNEYVTNALDFMEGSATLAEIARFGLDEGDVVITKDSETPDDIGIAAVIAEKIDRLVVTISLLSGRMRINSIRSIWRNNCLCHLSPGISRNAPVAQHGMAYLNPQLNL